MNNLYVYNINVKAQWQLAPYVKIKAHSHYDIYYFCTTLYKIEIPVVSHMLEKVSKKKTEKKLL